MDALVRGGRTSLRFVFDELIHEERRAVPHRKRIVLEPVTEDDDTLVAAYATAPSVVAKIILS